MTENDEKISFPAIWMYKICDVVLPQRGGSKPPPYAVYAAVSDSPTHSFHQYFQQNYIKSSVQSQGFLL
jgi:hypothetical protein